MAEHQNNSDIVTPVIPNVLHYLLKGYDVSVVDYLVDGFQNGFDLHYQGPRLFRSSSNLSSASQNPDIVSNKLQKELKTGRIEGPFVSPPFQNFQISPIGIVPKKEQGQFRLIHHLSFPENSSINDFIPDQFSRVHYASLDDAIDIIVSLGRGCLLAKTDIESAFRIIPIRKEDHELLGIHWEGLFFYDKCLPMGCASSCAIFEKFSTALEWIGRAKGKIPHIVHILDDFLFLGPPDADVCNQSLKVFQLICKATGVGLKTEKTSLACTKLVFLGIEIDTLAMEIRLPQDKLDKLKQTIDAMKCKRKVRLKELQSLIGLLNFSCLVVVPGRAFLRRLIDLTKGLTKPHHHKDLVRESRRDLAAWSLFINHFNGKTLMFKHVWKSSAHLHMYTDAAGSFGFGAIFWKKWFYGSWPDDLKGYSITLKELFPIVLAVEVWGSILQNSCVVFHSDNEAVVHIINAQTSRDPAIMILVRRFVLAVMRHNILFSAEHIPGMVNTLPDLLSRLQIKKFREMSVEMDIKPTIIPIHLLQLSKTQHLV
jgi:hypothetical protein